MYLLSDDKVELLRQRLHEQGISQTDLHTDLLDHICCIMEQLGPEVPFEQAWQLALAAVAPEAGLQQLEEERFFLFHFNKRTTMNRIIFATGFLTAFLISTGMTFKLMHWPLGNIVMGSGFLMLIVTAFVLLAKAIRHFSQQPVTYRIRIFIGILSALLISIGSIFKILHYPTANIQIVLGMALLNLVFLPLFFYQLYRQSQLQLGAN